MVNETNIPNKPCLSGMTEQSWWQRKSYIALLLCNGNVARSQIGAAYLRSYAPTWQVYSAGIDPNYQMHPLIMQVMAEAGFDLSYERSKHWSEYKDIVPDFVIALSAEAQDVRTWRGASYIYMPVLDPGWHMTLEQAYTLRAVVSKAICCWLEGAE